MKLKRREFLVKASIGSAAAASAVTLAGSLAGPIMADEVGGHGRRLFQFVAFSRAGVLDSVEHRVAMNGEGRFKVQNNGVVGQGQGSWAHFDNTPPVPKPIFAFGKWVAKKFVSYDPSIPATGLPGIFGRVQASRIDLEIDLVREFPSPAVIPATLHLVCNIGALGAAGSTGEPEGYVLAIPGTPFAEGAVPGPFVPLSPILGLSHTSVAED